MKLKGKNKFQKCTKRNAGSGLIQMHNYCTRDVHARRHFGSTCNSFKKSSTKKHSRASITLIFKRPTRHRRLLRQKSTTKLFRVLVANEHPAAHLLAFGFERLERDATAGQTYPGRKPLKDSINKTKGTILCTICADHSRVATRVRVPDKERPGCAQRENGDRCDNRNCIPDPCRPLLGTRMDPRVPPGV